MVKVIGFDHMGTPLSEIKKTISRRPLREVRRSHSPSLPHQETFDRKYTSTDPRLTITQEGFIFDGVSYLTKRDLPISAWRFLQTKSNH